MKMHCKGTSPRRIHILNQELLSVLTGRASHRVFEYFAEVKLICKPQRFCHLSNEAVMAFQQLFRFRDLQIYNVFVISTALIFLKNFTQIRLAYHESATDSDDAVVLR